MYGRTLAAEQGLVEVIPRVCIGVSSPRGPRKDGFFNETGSAPASAGAARARPAAPRAPRGLAHLRLRLVDVRVRVPPRRSQRAGRA